MNATLVLDPDAGFAELSRQLENSGWRLAGSAASPILPGEPEHAVFERDADRAFYTFNPVCRLRVLDVSHVADGASLPALPVVDGETVRRWLGSDDERTVLRGVLAAAQLGDAELAAAVEAHRNHPRAVIAAAAARAAQALRGAPSASDAERDAKAAALAAIDVLRAQLTPLLTALGQDADGSLTATLRPRPGDYERAFQPPVAAAAREAYETLWSTPPRIARVAPGSRLECHIAPAGMLRDANPLSRHFPGGYRAIAPLLDPHRVWVAWKLIEPGHTAGMAYDGLVWLDDHWTWFPKPYRVLSHLIH